jgi:Zn finger protein HypA/HybF involved in hydrogenase expression
MLMTEKRIKRNAARCNKCGNEIESTFRHDYVPCPCGAIAVDGGKDYLRRTGNIEDMTDLSEYYDD